MRKIALAAALVLAACGPRQSDSLRSYEIPLSQLPPYLKPLDGAAGAVAHGHEGSAGVRYQLKAPYPAADALASIRSRIGSEWTPRTEDFMNPGIPTSEVRGWTVYHDETVTPRAWIHRWSSEWQNAAGDILSYDLQYSSAGPYASNAPTVPATDQMKVVASVMPRSLVAEILRSLASMHRR